MSTIKVNKILTTNGGEGIDADIVGNLTGNVTGNVTGDVTGTATTATNALNVKDGHGNVRITSNESGMVMSGITTVTSGKLMVGTAYVSAGAVGMGTTTAAGRDAGIGTMTGSMIYNADLDKVQIYKPNRGWVDVSDSGDSLTEFSATGGIVGEYTDPGPGKHYKTHTYTTSGTFDYIAEYAGVAPVDIIMVGGGGGGGFGGGGGGAGGYIRTTSTPLGAVPGPASITVTVGAGGHGAGFGNALEPAPGTHQAQQGGTGGDTILSNPDNPDILTAKGGGGGMKSGAASSFPGTLAAGGSGGGSAHNGPSENNPGPATQPAYTAPISAVNSSIQDNLGFAGGGPGPGTYTGGGGGGAGGVGGNASPSTNDGGAGVAQTYEGGPGNPVLMAGGGGGGCFPSGSSVGGSGIGGGAPGPAAASTSGTGGTGSGGGGGSGSAQYFLGGNGGGGYCCIRYEVSAAPTATKATGGIVSFYNGKTIHLFLKSGTFTAPGSFSETVEYVVIGGGGGAGSYQGAGGGAGGYRTGSTPVSGPAPLAVEIGAGGSSGVQGNSPMTFPATPGGVGITDGQNGGQSSWNSITASGGGGGGAAYQGPGRNGGSGGGGAGSHPPGTPGPAGTGNAGGFSPPEGNNGQAGGTTSNSYAGGGGGAGAAGGSTGTNDGGIGVQLPATFRCPTYEPTNTTNPQEPLRGGGIGSPGPSGKYWVAGGGAGMAYAPVTVPSAGWPEGGAGGGGAGSYQAYSPPLYWVWTEISGMVNSGGGGGGSSAKGGGGGSGLVILAYPT